MKIKIGLTLLLLFMAGMTPTEAQVVTNDVLKIGNQGQTLEWVDGASALTDIYIVGLAPNQVFRLVNPNGLTATAFTASSGTATFASQVLQTGAYNLFAGASISPVLTFEPQAAAAAPTCQVVNNLLLLVNSDLDACDLGTPTLPCDTRACDDYACSRLLRDGACTVPCSNANTCLDYVCEDSSVDCDIQPPCTNANTCLDYVCEDSSVDCDIQPPCNNAATCLDYVCEDSSIDCEPPCENANACLTYLCRAIAGCALPCNAAASCVNYACDQIDCNAHPCEGGELANCLEQCPSGKTGYVVADVPVCIAVPCQGGIECLPQLPPVPDVEGGVTTVTCTLWLCAQAMADTHVDKVASGPDMSVAMAAGTAISMLPTGISGGRADVDAGDLGQGGCSWTSAASGCGRTFSDIANTEDVGEHCKYDSLTVTTTATQIVIATTTAIDPVCETV